MEQDKESRGSSKPEELYSALNTSKREARFLKIRPAAAETMKDQIECTMITSTLGEEYHAVSYVWGSTEDLKEILVNGHCIRVTTNLHDLLTVFRKNGKMLQSLLWIDAICINQQDLEERSEQVKIMGDIYSRAFNVHIWMGWPTHYTQALAQRMDAIPHYTKPGSAISTIVDDDEMWHELCRLTGHDWFTRVWVIQEAVRAKARIVWCGSNLFLLDILLNAGFALAGAVSNGMSGIQRKVDQDYIWRLQGKLTKFNPVSYRQDEDIKNVMNIFVQTQFSRCSDPRDHMYGLLSLLPPGISWIVDYRLSMAEVYASNTFELMSWAKSLEPLRLRQARVVDETLPSWVPDLTAVSPYINYDLGDESNAFNASAGAAFFAEYARPAELSVRAYEVDTVSVCHPYALLQSDPKPPPKDPDHDEERYMRRVLRRWRGMAVKHAKDDRDELANEIALWQAIASDKLPANYPSSSDTSDKGNIYVDAEMATGLSEWLYASDDDTKSRMNARLRAMLRVRIMGNYFFVTANGRMGSCYGGCKVGDIVYVLAGLSRPVLLRAKEEGDEQGLAFVSACYCDGVMNGELVREAAEHKTGQRNQVDEVFAKITLV